jgi:hypothetical protein
LFPSIRFPAHAEKKNNYFEGILLRTVTCDTCVVMMSPPRKPRGSARIKIGKAKRRVENPVPKSASPRSQLQEFFSRIFSADDEQIKQGIAQIRLILGAEDPPLAEAVAIQGAVPRLLQLLEHLDDKTREHAATCVMTLARGDREIVEVVLKHNGGIKCLQLLGPEQPESVREPMAWAVATLAGSCPIACDLLLAQNAMGIVIEAITVNPNNTLPTLRKLTWAMCQMCLHKPPLQTVAAALPVCYYLMQSCDTEVQRAACWTVSFISDGPQERIFACRTAGLIPIMLELLRTQRPTVTLPAIRTLGNLAAKSVDAAQAILDMGVLQLMSPLMQPCVEQSIRKECCWLLSNVASGTPAQVHAILDSGLMPFVVRCMSDPELDVNSEAVWVVANIGAASVGGEMPDLLRAAVEHFNCIPGLCTALRTGDVKICSTALEACAAVLEIGEWLCTAGPTGVNPYVAQFKEHGMLDILSNLVDSPDDTVESRASSIMDYLSAD